MWLSLHQSEAKAAGTDPEEDKGGKDKDLEEGIQESTEAFDACDFPVHGGGCSQGKYKEWLQHP